MAAKLSKNNNLDEEFTRLLKDAGITVNGTAPQDIQLHETGIVDAALARGNLALGEAYMNGAWDVAELDQFFYHILRGRINEKVNPKSLIWQALKVKLLNLQSNSRAFEVGEQHYDQGNDLYEAMLDSRLTYTCGYWRDTDNLEDAQTAKLDLICRKLKLEKGMRVLDIGCGWGSFMRYAAEHYGVECVGVTVSREQVAWAEKHHSDYPLTFKLQDYRELGTTEAEKHSFDRVVSIGMFEHVGRKNHRTFMQVAARCLKPEGLMLLHTIGKNTRNSTTDPWIDKYIFPNGDLPSIGQIGDAIDGVFVAEDLHNFGADYDKTLMAWAANFEAAWPELKQNYDETFYRMWRYYLYSCAGAFRARDIQLWQWVLSPQGQLGGYQRVS